MVLQKPPVLGRPFDPEAERRQREAERVRRENAFHNDRLKYYQENHSNYNPTELISHYVSFLNKNAIN